MVVRPGLIGRARLRVAAVAGEAGPQLRAPRLEHRVILSIDEALALTHQVRFDESEGRGLSESAGGAADLDAGLVAGAIGPLDGDERDHATAHRV
ncbi:MAG: hypothetical protein IPH44_43355 [Myxococcales bacterium]|nr:hypothetical protein [Myxococcales bacterium]